MWVEFNPNYKKRRGRAGDCSVRAVAKALNISWDRAFVEIAVAGFIYNSYEMGNSNRGMSRQQGQSMKRDSMGRFARNSGNYARGDGFWQELEALMQDAPNDTVRQTMQRMMQERHS